jgi:hypothetical protein
MGRRKGNTKRKKHAKRKTARAQIKRKARKRSAKRNRLALHRRRRAPASRKKTTRTPKRIRSSPLIEIAVREMNRGRSRTATARSLRLAPDDLRRTLKQLRLLKRKGKRWVFSDDRPRRIRVVTEGRTRNVIVRGYEQAHVVSEYHHAVRAFLRTNNLKFLKPFRHRTVQAMNGREFVLETDPNALHRIAAMDSPQFHEIYEITSNT